MANASIPPTSPTRAGHRAVVLGGGMAGLLAAAVLGRAYEEVALVERDRLRGAADPRRGVPQGKHVHVLLTRGAAAIEDILPGLQSELIRAGGVTADNLNQIHFEVDGHVLSQDDSRSSPVHLQSRPFLESHVLARIRSLANVSVLDGYDVTELLWDAPRGRVVGATVASRAAHNRRLDLHADLVVSALGRNGRAGAWLAQHGYEEPQEQQLRIDLRYASRRMRIDPGSMHGYRAVLVGAKPSRPCGVAILQQENDGWIVTVEGYAGHHPPTDAAGWLETAAQLAPPAFAPALRRAEPLSELSIHRFHSNLWRRYDKLGDFPRGFLVTGDSLCSFNPIYGQGMTVAALEAQELGASLRSGADDVAPRFFRQAAKPVKTAWAGAVGGDLSMPSEVVAGHRSIPVRAVNAYLDRYLEAAEHDPVMAWNFLDVTGLDKPAAALFTPHAVRCIARSLRHRTDADSEPGAA
jgi:2-polyprenyl-6-methoxyphenol hydroxylase-like FAD-dependent oxidoreductase